MSLRLSPPPPVDTRHAEAAELEAWVDLFAAASEADRRALGLRVDRADGLTSLRAPGVDHLLFNRTFGLRSRLGEAPLRAALGAFDTAGVGRYFVHATPRAAAALDPTLRAHGLERFHRSWIKLVRDAAPAPRVRTSLEVGPAQQREAPALAAILARGFDMPERAEPLLAALVGRPRWHVVAARDAGAPVAAGALFVHDGVGYLAMAATTPSHRRRGAQRALVAARIAAARAMGCVALVSETGEPVPDEPNPSEANLRAAGFTPSYARLNYVPRGVRWA